MRCLTLGGPEISFKRTHKATKKEGPHRLRDRAMDSTSKLRERITTLHPDEPMKTFYEKINPQCPANYIHLPLWYGFLPAIPSTTPRPTYLLTLTAP